jgi:hypothetical protein
MTAPGSRMSVTRWPPMDRVYMNATPPAVSGMQDRRRDHVGAVVHPVDNRSESAREGRLGGLDNANVQRD